MSDQSEFTSTHSPITVLSSDPNAQMQWRLPGTWNLVKLQIELKYLGRTPFTITRLCKQNVNISTSHDALHSTQ